MKILTSLPTAILSFAYTGVMGPHERRPLDYAAPRVVSRETRTWIASRPA